MKTEVPPQTLYQRLGVPREAKTSEIREAFRDLARLYHPDSKYYADIIHDPVRARHVALFHEILEAYHTLISPEKRREYDRTLPSPQPALEPGEDPSAAETVVINAMSRDPVEAEQSIAQMMRYSRRRSRKLVRLAYALAALAILVGIGLAITGLRRG